MAANHYHVWSMPNDRPMTRWSYGQLGPTVGKLVNLLGRGQSVAVQVCRVQLPAGVRPGACAAPEPLVSGDEEER